MELSWFRTPTPDRAGTLNLCFNALDRHVVSGHADEVAVLTPGPPVTVAVLLEQVAALAGGLRAVGVGPGAGVATALLEPFDDLLVTLAAARLGAVGGDVADPTVLATDDPMAARETAAAVRLLRRLPVEDAKRDLDWALLVRAGRQDPAPCADVPPDAAAYVVDGRVVSVRDAVDDPSPTGRLLAALCERRPVDLV